MSKGTLFNVCWIALLLANFGFSQGNDKTKIDDELVNFVANANVCGGEYSIERFSNLARNMCGLDDSTRVKELEKFCKQCDRKGNHINGIIICQMLFQPHRPLLGGAEWIRLPENEIRVAEPIVFVNSTPILGVRGYVLGGVQQTSHDFMRQCLASRIWVQKIGGLDRKQIKNDLDWYMEFVELKMESNKARLVEQENFFLNQLASSSIQEFGASDKTKPRTVSNDNK